MHTIPPNVYRANNVHVPYQSTHAQNAIWGNATFTLHLARTDGKALVVAVLRGHHYETELTIFCPWRMMVPGLLPQLVPGPSHRGFQMPIKRPTSGGRARKRQLYSEPFTLWEAASFSFQH